MLDGVVLAADCRVTLERSGLPAIYVDNAQKLFTLNDETSLAFVGDVRAAAHLLRALAARVGHRRNDPVSLLLWLSRLFRYEFARYSSTNSGPGIAFMVAQVLRGRPNRLRREEVVKLFKHIRSDGHPFRRNWYPGWIMSVLATPPEQEFVWFAGTHRSVLYSVRSPDFNVEPHDTFQFAAIGSGEISKTYIARTYDMIVAGDGGTELFFLRDAIRDCVRDEKIQTVGGMYPALKVSAAGTVYLGEGVQLADGTNIELVYESGQWIQRNLSTRKEIRLIPPWQICGKETESREFDDVEVGLRRMKN
jgi:proteasome subunit B (beta)-like protein